MSGANITAAFGSAGLRESIVYLLRQNSYEIEDLSIQGAGLIRLLLASPPSLLICDFDFFGINGLETLRIIAEDGICPVMLLLRDSEREAAENLADGSDNLYIVQRPVNRNVFINNLEFILRNIDRISSLEKEVTGLKETLETKRLVDKAKNIVMKKLEITEEAAHRLLQKKSMETRRPVRELAIEILKSENGI
jgi:two-component system, response regulator PdtaR